MKAEVSAAPVMPARFLIPFVGLMLGLNAFSNDILLPAYFAIATDLATPIERVQSLIPIFLIAAGCGQLVSGPLSDRFGRKPLIWAGLAIFLCGSLVCVSAGSIPMLQFGRLVQGFGSACLVVVGRAVLRDTLSGAELARGMALTTAFFAFGPILAPMTGVALMALGGWRAVLMGIVVAIICLAIAAFFGFKETHSDPDLAALDPARLKQAVGRVLGHPQSRMFLATAAVLQFTIVSLVANSPRLFKTQFGIEGATYAILFALSASGIIVGQLLNHRLIGRVGVLRATRIAALMLLVAAGSMVFFTALSWQSAPLFLLQLAFFNTWFMVVMSNAASLVLEPHRDIAGLTASLYGFITQITGSVLALATFHLFGGRLLPWSIGLLVAMVIVNGLLQAYRARAD